MPPIRRTSSAGTTLQPSDVNSTSDASVAQPVAQVDRTSRLADLGLSAQAVSAALVPTLKPLPPASILKALGDGQATLEVPLKPGPHKVRGVWFTIRPGTVARVHVEVKDGALVSVGDGRRGTSLRIEPPLDLPLWVTGRGVELTGPAAQQEFTANLGGFFDLSFNARKLNELASGPQQVAAVEPVQSEQGEQPSVSSEGSDLALTSFIDLGNLKVDADVTLREAELDLGGPKVRVDDATKVHVRGDGARVTLTGRVSLDGFSMNEGGIKLASRGGGSADLTATAVRHSGGYKLEAKLANLSLSVDHLKTVMPSAVVPGQVDRVFIGPSEVHDSTLSLTTLLGVDGLRVTAAGPVVSLALNGSGTVKDVQLNVKDTNDAAHFSAAGAWQGRIAAGADGVNLDLRLTEAHVDVRDLQQRLTSRSAISIEHATVDGDVHVAASHGSVQVDGHVRALDVLVDDFKGGGATATMDFGRTEVTGLGEVHFGSESGLQVDGRFHADVNLESLNYDGRRNVTRLGKSTLTGDLTRLDLGDERAEVRFADADAKVSVQNTTFDIGKTTVHGGGDIAGKGTVVLDATGFSLDGKSQFSMALADGRVRSSTVDLKLGRGSHATLLLNELHTGKVSHVDVRPGTRIDAVLAGGSLRVKGQSVVLAPGGRAELVVTSADFSGRAKRELRGSLLVDAGLQADLSAFEVAGVKVRPTDVAGHVKVAVDDVSLVDDQLTLDGVDATLDARVGNYTGVKTAGQPGIGSLKDPIKVLSVAEVQGTSAAVMAGVTPPEQGAPVEALRLLREGELNLAVPLTGPLNALGHEVPLPPGARVDLALAVRDGKLVAEQSRVSLSGFRAAGVELLGAHLSEDLRVRIDLRIAGRTLSVHVPHFRVPGDMETIADLAAGRRRRGGSGSSKFADAVDLSHARLDVSNATFARGQIALPGGVVEVAEGSKLSLHGTPLAGELSGSVGLETVTVARDDFAMDGGPGRGELKVKWTRQADKALVEGSLDNLAIESKVLARKAANGDYISLGAGRLSGASLNFDSELALDEQGIPKRHVRPVLKRADLNVGAFTGALLGARKTAARGTAEVGGSHIDGSLTFSTEHGLGLKAKLDEVDAQVRDVHVQRAGRNVELEHARLAGHGGQVDFSQTRVAVEAPQLAWEATIADMAASRRRASVQVGTVHISGEGRFDYDSARDLRLAGTLSVELSGGQVHAARAVTVNRKTGVVVE